jgi:hypothetical protein
LEHASDEEERLGLYHRLLHTSQRISEERLAINLLGKLTLTLMIPANVNSPLETSQFHQRCAENDANF